MLKSFKDTRMPTGIYRIFLGDELLGQASNLEDDMPWRKGRFESTSAFEKYRRFFSVATQLGEKKMYDIRDELLDGIYALGLRIKTPEGESWLPCIGTDLKPGG